MSKKLKYIKTFKEFINENMKIDIEPYYNKDFKQKLENFLLGLGYEDIEFTSYGVGFHNSDYDDKLMNKNAPIIVDFIDNYGYDSDDFSVNGCVIMYPTNY